MKIDILTLFPDFFGSPFDQSLIARASGRDLLDLKTWNIRDFAPDRHRVVDDEPYGGGAGMVMKIEPVHACLQNVLGVRGAGRTILLSPRGRIFTQETAGALSREEHLIFICGRYEGIDDRIQQYVDDEISIGDYVLMGGEAAALVVIEAVARLVSGVVGKEESVRHETFADGILEHPHYTRPADFNGLTVPEVLISGDHAKIAGWRRCQALLKTLRVRPDLLEKAELSAEDVKMLNKVKKENAC